MNCYYCNSDKHEDNPCPKRRADAKRFIESSPYRDKETSYRSPLGKKRKAYICRFSGLTYVMKSYFVDSLYVDPEEVGLFRQKYPASYFLMGRPCGLGPTFYLVDPITGNYKDVTDYDGW